LLQTTDPSGLVTDYAYDKHGRLQQSQETDRTTGSVRVTAYGYDVMGRRVAIWNDRSGLSYTNTAGFGLLKLAGR
jgi:YD repeat-containing protein